MTAVKEKSREYADLPEDLWFMLVENSAAAQQAAVDSGVQESEDDAVVDVASRPPPPPSSPNSGGVGYGGDGTYRASAAAEGTAPTVSPVLSPSHIFDAVQTYTRDEAEEVETILTAAVVAAPAHLELKDDEAISRNSPLQLGAHGHSCGRAGKDPVTLPNQEPQVVDPAILRMGTIHAAAASASASAAAAAAAASAAGAGAGAGARSSSAEEALSFEMLIAPLVAGIPPAPTATRKHKTKARARARGRMRSRVPPGLVAVTDSTSIPAGGQQQQQVKQAEDDLDDEEDQSRHANLQEVFVFIHTRWLTCKADRKVWQVHTEET